MPQLFERSTLTRFHEALVLEARNNLTWLEDRPTRHDQATCTREALHLRGFVTCQTQQRATVP